MCHLSSTFEYSFYEYNNYKIFVNIFLQAYTSGGDSYKKLCKILKYSYNTHTEVVYSFYTIYFLSHKI